VPIQSLNRWLLYTLVAGLAALFFLLRLPAEKQVAAHVLNGLVWLSFCAAASLLDTGAEKNKDDAYLYYLGVSGLRMLLFLATIGLALYFLPALRHRPMVLGLTLAYLGQTVIEVTTFVRKLRQIFRSTPN
jgi:hypothetical protein